MAFGVWLVAIEMLVLGNSVLVTLERMVVMAGRLAINADRAYRFALSTGRFSPISRVRLALTVDIEILARLPAFMDFQDQWPEVLEPAGRLLW